jgi:hypothetical protein
METCEIMVLGKPMKAPHFLLKDGRCKRCGQYFNIKKPQELFKQKQVVKRGRYSGKSKSANRFNDYQ